MPTPDQHVQYINKLARVTDWVLDAREQLHWSDKYTIMQMSVAISGGTGEILHDHTLALVAILDTIYVRKEP